jgi:lysophospholipase L1-like esterase
MPNWDGGSKGMDGFAAYLSIGDSMSIDTYPYFELSAKDPNVSQLVGAASLLHRNNSQLWPEFDGKDLVSTYPEIMPIKLALDGATTLDFSDASTYQSFVAPYASQPVLVTMTIGGNDLLNVLMKSERDKGAAVSVEPIMNRFDLVVKNLTTLLPRAICVFTTIYDPTDGSGSLPGFIDFPDRLPLLQYMNEHIKLSAKKSNALLADVYTHFQGHGLAGPKDDFWYWGRMPIEPSARGASEIRRLWYEALAREGLVGVKA